MARKKPSTTATIQHPNGTTYDTELVDIAVLKEHPRNYRKHPEDQLRHIGESLRQHGFYRNVVVARDNTILAGHGVVKAAQQTGLTTVPVFRLNVLPDSPLALKVLAGDNELTRFADTDDRALTDLLREVAREDESGLLGTGFDEKMLAALVMNTRMSHEIANMDEAAEWVGMPEYDPGDPQIRLIITFKTAEDQQRFAQQHPDITIDKASGRIWTTRWPFTEREDVAGIRFEQASSTGKSKAAKGAM